MLPFPHETGRNDEKRGPFGDWPNSIGFDVFREETTPVEIPVRGRIPEYALGVLYRTGPGGYQVPTNEGKTFSIQHWFDGFGQAHRFHIISPTKVIYNSRRTCDSLVRHIQETGSIPNIFTFAQRRDPCKGLWGKFLSIFCPTRSISQDAPDSANVSVTLSIDFPGLPTTGNKGEIRSLYAKTDACMLQGLHPQTLEPVSMKTQVFLHPELKGQLSSSHAQTDRATGDVFNFNLEIGPRTVYRVFRSCKATGKTEILATITDAPPAYIHSFFLTENYIVLCIFSAHFGLGGAKILLHRNLLDALDDVAPGRDARWYVIDRHHGRGVVKRLDSPPFFAFHSSNAWEVAGGIMLELPAFESIEVIKKFYYHHLKGDSEEAAKWVGKGRPRYMRMWLPGIEEPGVGTTLKVWERHEDVSMELPTINPVYATRPHRYTYGLVNRLKSTLLDGIIKHDSSPEQKHLLWECHAHTPGEAIFVPDPQGAEEDDGVLLSVVLNGRTAKSYLLVLDAKTMVEVARAEMEYAIAFGFHGTFAKGRG